MTLTQVQSLALATFCSLIFIVVGGSLIEWAKWIALYFAGVKPARTVKSPQITVGLFDILVTVLVLVMFFLLASVLWRSLGLPAGVRPQPAAMVTDSSLTNTSNQRSSNPSEETAAPKDDVPAEETDRNSTTTEPDTEREPATIDLGSEETSNGPIVTNKPLLPQVGVSQVQFIYSGYAMSCQLLCVIFMTYFIMGRTNCSLKKLGWRTDQWNSDIRAGFQCFLMITPLILVLNAVLQNVTKTPYEHPVQVMIREYPWLLGIAFWQAAVCAPISEEFAFRALLVGWFESIHFGRNKFKAFMLGETRETNTLPTHMPTEVRNLSPSDASNPYSASNVPQHPDAHSNQFAMENPSEIRAPWWPVLLSGTIFGLAHYNYGISWFPLIIFGVVLGRMYQIRQSLIPGIVVHMLFNAMNVALLGLSLLAPKLS